MSITSDTQQNRRLCSNRECVICGSKAIGTNFGALTCAPCKAFFRRNARRKEIRTSSSCQHYDVDLNVDNQNKTIRYLQIRRCSSCRLRRCFAMGMREDLVRTGEENIRHKQLVDMNRRRREAFRQKQQEKRLSIPQYVENKNQFLRESDWQHLSNIISTYDTYCLKTYVQQRSMMFNNKAASYQHDSVPMKHCKALPMNLTVSLFSFLGSLPAFHSLSHVNRTYLFKINLRSLLFPNISELSQSCFSEPWQISLDKDIWKVICGPELFEQFVRIEKLAEKSLIADPIITRLWIIVLFFSSSLSCLYDRYTSIKIPRKKTTIIRIQDFYVTLLWNYLLHRYGNLGAIQIYSNLIHVYLKMQRVGFDIGIQVRTRNELMNIHETMNQLLTVDTHDS